MTGICVQFHVDATGGFEYGGEVFYINFKDLFDR